MTLTEDSVGTMSRMGKGKPQRDTLTGGADLERPLPGAFCGGGNHRRPPGWDRGGLILFQSKIEGSAKQRHCFIRQHNSLLSMATSFLGHLPSIPAAWRLRGAEAHGRPDG